MATSDIIHHINTVLEKNKEVASHYYDSYLGSVLVIVHASGSIADSDIAQFIDCIEALQKHCPARIRVVPGSYGPAPKKGVHYLPQDEVHAQRLFHLLSARGGEAMMEVAVQEIAYGPSGYDAVLLLSTGYFGPFSIPDISRRLYDHTGTSTKKIPPMVLGLVDDYEDAVYAQKQHADKSKDHEQTLFIAMLDSAALGQTAAVSSTTYSPESPQC